MPEEERGSGEVEAFESDIKSLEENARKSLDEILSEKKIRFCARCNRKVSSRLDWSGKCLHEPCDNLLCNDCWYVKRHRYCRAHAKDVKGPEAKGVEKDFFAEPPAEHAARGIIKAAEEAEEETVNRLRNLGLHYAKWLEKRFQDFGPVDWSPEGFFGNPKFRLDETEEGYILSVFTKRWFMHRERLRIVVTPISITGKTYLESLIAYLAKGMKKSSCRTLFVLVSDDAGGEAASFASRYSDPASSVYVIEPEKATLLYNIKDAATRSYTDWLSPKNEKPSRFEEKLKRSADIVSGKHVISVKAAMDAFGFPPRKAMKILGRCRFLENVKGTDTFFWKTNG